MRCCIFHNDRHPSMKLYDDHFYCFGCGAHGDVIDLTAHLFGLRNYDAAKKLAVDFNITAPLPQKGANDSESDFQSWKKMRSDHLYCSSVISTYLDLLKDWKVRYAPQNRSEDWDKRFLEAGQYLEYVDYLDEILTYGSAKETNPVITDLMRDNKIYRLNDHINRWREEAAHEQKTETGCINTD